MTDLVIEGFRLSPQQKRLWLLQREDPVYLSQCAAEIDRPLEAEVLRRALEAVVTRHEILRTTFRCLPGMDVPVQVIEEAAPVALDLVRLERACGESDVERALSTHAERPFEFERGPLLRVSLLEPAEGVPTLVVSLPAICADPSSLKNLLAEIGEVHDTFAGGRERDGAAVQYADFSEWQNELLQDEAGGEARAFWSREWSTMRGAPVLPFARRSGSARFQPRSSPSGWRGI